MVYLTEARSQARRGRRFGVKWASPERTPTLSTQLTGWAMAVILLALVLATSNPISSVSFANFTVVFVVMLLIQAVGALLHNRTRVGR